MTGSDISQAGWKQKKRMVMAKAKAKAFNESVTFKDPHHEALVGVWWTGQLLKKHANRFFRKHRSSDIQVNILMQLKVADRPLNQQELSERLFVDKSNLTGVAGRMEAAGLIAREANPQDRRAYCLRLTEAGDKTLTKLEGPYWEEVRGIMKQFSVKEVEMLTDMMRKMQIAVQQRL